MKKSNKDLNDYIIQTEKEQKEKMIQKTLNDQNQQEKMKKIM